MPCRCDSYPLHHFNQIKRQYSLECWNEITEELALAYTPQELELIKEWLTGMPWRTTYDAMKEKAAELWSETQDSNKLLMRFDDLIRDLYQSGVIGNYHKNGKRTLHRWYFRGDETLLKTQDIQIHRIFSTVLSTIKPGH